MFLKIKNFFRRKNENYINLFHTKRFLHYKSLGLRLDTVLDIGAFNGDWTKMFKKIFPEANILMIEANTEKEDLLKKVGNYVIALLGKDDDKEVTYFKCKNSTIASGNSIYEEDSIHKFETEKRKTKKLSSIPNVLKKYDLIKLDTQGSELDIIKGSLDIIKNTRFLLLELSLVNYNKGSPLLHEVLSFLNNINFELIDFFEFHYEENKLIQVDGFLKIKNSFLKIFKKNEI